MPARLRHGGHRQHGARAGREVPKLPSSMQATVQAETQVGLRLAAVGEVKTVAVSAETVTIALAPGAVAMRSPRPERWRQSEKGYRHPGGKSEAHLPRCARSSS